MPVNPQFAITGGIACGKSTVGNLLTGFGVHVLDTDRVGHNVIRKDSPAFDEIVHVFGHSVVGADGEIHRPTLGNMVFADPEKRIQLNRIVHPCIQREWREWMNERRRHNETAAVQIPLLFEVNATYPWDGIVCVSAPVPQILQRLVERGLTETEAKQRMAAQLPLSEKIARSDFHIKNTGTLNQLEEQTLGVLEAIRKTQTI